MAKRFKLKLSRVIPSFQTCRSKDPSNLPSNPVPSVFRLSPVNHNPITLHLLPAPPSQPSKSSHHSSSIKRHVSSAFSSMRSGFRSRSSVSEPGRTKSKPQQEFHWEKEGKWHVVQAKLCDESPRQKIYNSSVSGNESGDDNVFLPPQPAPRTGRRKRRVKKKRTASKIRVSTSSATDSGLFFSSEGFDNVDDEVNDDETETLVSSSRSFSSDSSSEFNPHLETIREAPFTRKKSARKTTKRRHCVVKKGPRGTRNARRSFCGGEALSPARLSRFQWLIPCTVEGKVRESFAVVKKSEDPREDFKRSMMEMIMEKQMFEEKDLEQLLHCFLSLNSRHHHGVIVQAFAEIWESLFCRRMSVTCT
ncbi:hypothetical protein Tsubulata_033462 [Turnera subulata]|uniref:Transcription repressor n=1 Tax=Turnera subulata TaxID=218843 RepID=A0A9Q0FZL0_9ROSI|nr:hypothetical protein Tsubulata_033462 [Turnera subulata]